MDIHEVISNCLNEYNSLPLRRSCVNLFRSFCGPSAHHLSPGSYVTMLLFAILSPFRQMIRDVGLIFYLCLCVVLFLIV